MEPAQIAQAVAESHEMQLTAKLLTAVYWLIAIAGAGSFGAGVWVTRVHAQLEAMRVALEEIRTNSPPKWIVETLKRHEANLERYEERIDRLGTELRKHAG